MRFLCVIALALSSCATRYDPHTEVTSDLMWTVNDGRVMTITCRNEAGKTEQVKITSDAFLKQRKGISVTLLDLALGVVGWFFD